MNAIGEHDVKFPKNQPKYYVGKKEKKWSMFWDTNTLREGKQGVAYKYYFPSLYSLKKTEPTGKVSLPGAGILTTQVKNISNGWPFLSFLTSLNTRSYNSTECTSNNLSKKTSLQGKLCAL